MFCIKENYPKIQKFWDIMMWEREVFENKKTINSFQVSQSPARTATG
jgi:hypothetical protein